MPWQAASGKKRITMTNSYYTKIDSPLGKLLITSNGKAITGLYTPGNSHYKSAQEGIESDKPFKDAIKQLKEYFAGKRKDFDLPLDLGGTAFQSKVWKTLQKIPYGKTFSYKQTATKLGMPQASRAVGTANGRNPVCIIVPCHRVINANGGLGGYNGGLKVKEWLLNHEQAAG